MKYIFVTLVIFANVSAHILFKYASMELTNSNFFSVFTNPKVILGGLIQIIALFSWINLLKYVELYWAALMTASIPLTLTIIGVILFNEVFTLQKFFAAIIIIAGLILINV
jgi:drug/metabolite transporter (DMT)-like permease